MFEYCADLMEYIDLTSMMMVHVFKMDANVPESACDKGIQQEDVLRGIVIND